MKRTKTFGRLITLYALMGPSVPTPYLAIAEENELVEVPIEMVLAPEKGFDDNDPNITFVVHGSLPNSCYVISTSEVTKSESGKTYSVRQFAERLKEGVCAQPSLPPHVAMLVPYTKEVRLGKLKKGSYRVAYRAGLRPDSPKKMRKIVVSAAATPSVDNLPYALVSGATVPVAVEEGKPTQFTISGALNSGCTELDEVRITRVKDTFIILPTVRVRTGELCIQMLIPFEKGINLGTVPTGHYLVHIRSMGGNALNQVFEINARNP